MLVAFGHGKQRCGYDTSAEKDCIGKKPDGPSVPNGGFHYLFPDADDLREADLDVRDLDGLAEAMIEADGESATQNSKNPPILTYFGQFVDHDITAGTDREVSVSRIADNDIRPLERSTVVASIANLRDGSMRLDSLYGDPDAATAFERKLQGLMRFPGDRSKMWIAQAADPGIALPTEVPFPTDGAADLLRLGRLMTGNSPAIMPAELDALEGPLREAFVNADGSPRIQRAIIGDGRNDENLLVAQLHLAFLRFHNRVVDSCRDEAVLSGGPDAVFAWARQQVTFTYQWLTLNRYLTEVCDRAVVEDVLDRGSPLYSAFLRRVGQPSDPARLPVPLEFSVAAFRFGHTMVRAAYDFNRFFGRAADGSQPFIPRAPFDLLFAFTGGGNPPMPRTDGVADSFDKLPAHWIIEWDRFARRAPAEMPDRSARKIDTCLATPLDDLVNEQGLPPEIFKRLARRNLRRGFLLNLPTGQDCVARVNDALGLSIAPLSVAELRSGKTGDHISDALCEKTPLWFYVLKEAETRGSGESLGPLGSYLVADTIAGLVINDPESYWNHQGSNGDRWSPSDGAQPAGRDVDSFVELLRAALLVG